MNDGSNASPQQGQNAPTLEPHYSEPPGSEPSFGQRLKKLFGPIGVILVVIAKFAAKIKFLLLPLIKFLPVVLKTGGTMVLSVGVYAMNWGWKFALGFVLLLFVHERRCSFHLWERSSHLKKRRKTRGWKRGSA
jgi:hypothetical protein